MKTCFKCNTEKPYGEFYRHKAMADGYLNKCKECAKQDSHSNYLKKLKDPEWVEKELGRQREKSRKAREKGASNPVSYSDKKRWANKNKHKRNAHQKVKRAILNGNLFRMPCEICGVKETEAHHEDYSRPLHVTWLCKKHHNERHNELRKIERMTKTMIQLNEKKQIA